MVPYFFTGDVLIIDMDLHFLIYKTFKYCPICSWFKIKVYRVRLKIWALITF